MEVPNMDYLNKLSGGDPDFIEQIVDVVTKEFPIERKRYLSLINSSNLQEASSLAHKIKHKLSIFGFKDSYQVTVQHENLLKNGDTSLHIEFMNILDGLQHYIATYSHKS